MALNGSNAPLPGCACLFAACLFGIFGQCGAYNPFEFSLFVACVYRHNFSRSLQEKQFAQGHTEVSLVTV